MLLDTRTLKAFLSHNSHDKPEARTLGGQLKLVGADIWFDEWEIRAGDSIPGKVSEALDQAETLILLWSSYANQSDWVGSELEAAISRAITDKSFRVIPVCLDETPLPALIRRLKRVDLSGGDVARAVDEIMGFTNVADRLRAIQATLDEAGIQVEFFPGYGAVVCCPKCGASADRLTGWSDVDHTRDTVYAGFECKDCHFSNGGEI